jgi:ketosteroid isomerase-like protein
MVDSTTRERRNELIDEYFAATDAATFDEFHDLFAEDITYTAMGQTVEGVGETIDWYENKLAMEDTFHHYDTRIHGDDISVAFGQFGGEMPDGTCFEALGLDLFEFNETTSEITSLTIFTALPPRV